ncbi:ATP-dependent helicase [Nakamurella flavida]|uniref:DNA 3'-5' helicase n=1 Tax=Nakamurella flavida TaxID=363630 RepID=A0A938YC69_9ACTN|nr:ATP-dependent DNA helicase [Nakamurella flavida]MBM9474966.1 ATP-dependent helicase [Nakamurella flavida]MDP9776535.1 superfamily I DNA/RNA helicase/RecB family exonuclease [Nakamurella flavida]
MQRTRTPEGATQTAATARGPAYRVAFPAARATPVPSPAQQAVIDHPGGRLRVLAGPGTGKSSTLVEAVGERVMGRGVDPESILVLTFSRRAAAELTERLARRVRVTTREPLVRTLHGYAYSVLRRHAHRTGEPVPRLLSAGESDLMVRELLVGHRDAGTGLWPDAFTGALGTPRFAAEVRDLLMRAAERGLSPARLAEWGRRARRPEWRAVAALAREYQDVADLRQGSNRFGAALDQAELTAAAVAVLRDDRALAAEQARVRRVFVDEYQDVDPAQARLIEMVASGADELIVLGDPDQAIYAFRGAEPAALRDIEVDTTVTLTDCHRMVPELVRATRLLARGLPGPGVQRELHSTQVEPGGGPTGVEGPPALEVRVFPTASAEAAYAADVLRRAHLADGVPWADMAVLVRSPEASLPVIRRAFGTAGVPIQARDPDRPLTQDPTVAALLTVLRCTVDPAALTGEIALALLTGPLGRVDPLRVRQLRRRLRAVRQGEGSTADLIAAVLAGAALPADLADDLREPLARLSRMVAVRSTAGTDAVRALWEVWERSGLADRLGAQAVAGGRAGRAADATLDAVVALFEWSGDHADRLPGAGVQSFLDVVAAEPLTPESRSAAQGIQAVRVMSAHAAKGLEWQVVVLVGVQEGRWPDLRGRTDLLGADELLQAAAGLPATVSRTAGLLADERRLFYVAATRARSRLVVTAVSAADSEPSRFLGELSDGTADLPAGWPGDAWGPRRELQMTGLVAELRRIVGRVGVDEEIAQGAARQLARLAAAGVPGAHPAQWFGLGDPSGRSDWQRGPVVVSPSAVESISVCSLRGVLERRGGRTPAGQAQIDGSVVHALAQGLGLGVPTTELTAQVEAFLDRQAHLPPWQVARARRSLSAMMTAAQEWVGTQSADREFLGSEQEVSATLPADDGGPSVVISGRVDWLSRRPDGSVVVSDFKTGATPPTRAQVVENAQLAVYQLALALGHDVAAGTSADPSGAPAARQPGGGELIHLRTGRPKVYEQPALDPEDHPRWAAQVREVARRLTDSGLEARQNPACDRCPVRGSCPLRDEGRQVTR